MRVTLPQNEVLEALLRLQPERPRREILERIECVITNPLQRFLSHDGKALRAKAVEAGFLFGVAEGELSVSERRSCGILAEAIETIHAGSLIVDDIQDQAKVRRGAPAFHRTEGLAAALNAGNLLYFLGLQKVASAGLSGDLELACSRRFHEALLRGHYGQAVDVGTSIDAIPQEVAAEISLAAIRLKSGTLMALAITSGAAASGRADARLDALDEFGHRLGMGLQMFDDLKNVSPAVAGDPNAHKRLEDLILRRPSWMWAYAASRCAPTEYSGLIQAVRQLPEESALSAWLTSTDLLEQAREAALDFTQAAFVDLESQLTPSRGDRLALEELRSVAERFGVVF